MDRGTSLKIRKNETNIIKILENYAKAQGSKNYNKLYLVYTKLVYKTLGIQSGNRDNLSPNILSILSTMEILIAQTVIELMKKNVHYKIIYITTKEKLYTLKELLYIENQNSINNLDLRLVS